MARDGIITFTLGEAIDVFLKSKPAAVRLQPDGRKDAEEYALRTRRWATEILSNPKTLEDFELSLSPIQRASHQILLDWIPGYEQGQPLDISMLNHFVVDLTLRDASGSLPRYHSIRVNLFRNDFGAVESPSDRT